MHARQGPPEKEGMVPDTDGAGQVDSACRGRWWPGSQEGWRQVTGQRGLSPLFCAWLTEPPVPGPAQVPTGAWVPWGLALPLAVALQGPAVSTPWALVWVSGGM